MMKIIRHRKTHKIKRIKIGKRDKDIIKAIGMGVGLTAVLTAAIIAPNTLQALKPFLKQRGPKGLRRKIQELKDKGYLYLGGDNVRLTNKGLQLQKLIKIEETTLKKPRQWDGYWRLISYDVPEIGKRDRDYFRQTINKWGLRMIQESLWVYPYNCKEEIAVLADGLNIAPHVIYMMTDQMPEEDKWQEYFEL